MNGESNVPTLVTSDLTLVEEDIMIDTASGTGNAYSSYVHHLTCYMPVFDGMYYGMALFVNPSVCTSVRSSARLLTFLSPLYVGISST